MLRQTGTEATRVFGKGVTGNYFEMLGLRPHLRRFPAGTWPVRAADAHRQELHMLTDIRLAFRTFSRAAASSIAAALTEKKP